MSHSHEFVYAPQQRVKILATGCEGTVTELLKHEKGEKFCVEYPTKSGGSEKVWCTPEELQEI